MSAASSIVPPYPFSGGAISVNQGKTQQFRLQVLGVDTKQPVDISKWTSFLFTAKLNWFDPDTGAIISKSLGNGIVLMPTGSAVTTGVVEITVNPNDTKRLPNQIMHCFAELQGTDENLAVWPLWQGELDIVPSVTGASL